MKRELLDEPGGSEMGSFYSGRRTQSPMQQQMDQSSDDQPALYPSSQTLQNSMTVDVLESLLNGGSVQINQPSAQHGYLNSPGLVASAPATPAHLYQSHHIGKYPKSSTRSMTPSYSLLHSHCGGGGVAGGKSQGTGKSTRLFAADQKPPPHTSNQSNFFQFPPASFWASAAPEGTPAPPPGSPRQTAPRATPAPRQRRPGAVGSGPQRPIIPTI